MNDDSCLIFVSGGVVRVVLAGDGSDAYCSMFSEGLRQNSSSISDQKIIATDNNFQIHLCVHVYHNFHGLFLSSKQNVFKFEES